MIAQPQRTNQKGKESGWAGCSGPRPAETCKVSARVHYSFPAPLAQYLTPHDEKALSNQKCLCAGLLTCW